MHHLHSLVQRYLMHRNGRLLWLIEYTGIIYGKGVRGKDRKCDGEFMYVHLVGRTNAVLS